MENKYYAGIGSRETPTDICNLITKIATKLSSLGYVLRSGHAAGADRAFEIGCMGKGEIYLPWPGFGTKQYNGDPGMKVLGKAIVDELAWESNWEILNGLGLRPNHDSQAVRKLHGRNYAQVFGLNNQPVKFVLCWTKAGAVIGGTASAIKLANHYNIPVFNLGLQAVVDRMTKFIQE